MPFASWCFFTNPVEKNARQNGFHFPKVVGAPPKILLSRFRCTKINMEAMFEETSPHPSEYLTMNGCYSAEVDELPPPDVRC